VTRDVILAPGLWMPGVAMSLLAARLKRSGYAPHLFTYPGRSALNGNVARFVRFARETLDGRPAHFVGHSLGGVLLLQALSAHEELQVASVVLLGAPVRGCLAGRRLGAARMGRWMMGSCSELWQEHDAVWRRKEPLGVVAGTAALGLGRAFGRLPGANDGVVRVEETAVDGMSAQALVPLGHSMLIVSATVYRLVERFMLSGRFE
jgi:pimeloyl-ACP methyl ester carboxylesterase